MSGRLYLHCWEHRSDSYTVLLWSRSIAVTLSVLIRAVLTLPNSSPQLASEGAAARTESTDSVRIVLMRPVPIAAVAVWLAAAGGGLKAAPFAGLDQAAGVYVTVDGHGITIRQSAVDWDFYVPDGSKAKWKKGRGFGEAPHVKITCRAEGGYRRAERPEAVWTVPQPDGMPTGLGRKQRAQWNRLWPWTWGDNFLLGGTEEALDLGLSAVVEGTGLSLSRGAEGNRFTVRAWFLVNSETAVAARQLAKHCAAN